MSYHRLLAALLCALITPTAVAADDNFPAFKGGHTKYLFLLNTFPDDSLFPELVNTPAIDHKGDLRLKFDWRTDKVSLVTDYQLIAQHGDSVTLAGKLPGVAIIPDPVASDDNRLFDLTRVITQDNNTIVAHRLDRLYVDITATNTVARIGRQVVSWGNGLVYTPMDFFNPFDPATVDKEYKTGDDMLYGQYLQSNGNDLQAVWVIRRDDDGDITNNVNSLAAKYHGFAGEQEYDLLLATHYDDTIFGLGGITNAGGAIWRGDITLTRTGASTLTPGKNITSLVTSLSYSWLGWDHNFNGLVEYFYNGFGQSNNDYSPAALAANPELVERIVRGELFTLGRNYLALSAMVEMTPLWMLTPNAFINLDDHSFLFQLVSAYDFKQDWQLLAAISLPAGAAGTEYGGIDSGVAGKQLSTELNLFAQLAWYF